MNISATIREVQSALKKQFPDMVIDGIAGPQTWSAIHSAIVDTHPAAHVPLVFADRVDDRSEKNIATLLPELHPYGRALVTRGLEQGIDVKIIGGTRTCQEQNALYAKGRTVPGKIVTNAKGGHSNHNFGIAFDVGIFIGTAYADEMAATGRLPWADLNRMYGALGAIGAGLGLEWGGNWKNFVDQPHFQLRPPWAAGLAEPDMLRELRARRATGTAAFA